MFLSASLGPMCGNGQKDNIMFGSSCLFLPEIKNKNKKRRRKKDQEVDENDDRQSIMIKIKKTNTFPGS